MLYKKTPITPSLIQDCLQRVFPSFAGNHSERSCAIGCRLSASRERHTGVDLVILVASRILSLGSLVIVGVTGSSVRRGALDGEFAEELTADRNRFKL